MKIAWIPPKEQNHFKTDIFIYNQVSKRVTELRDKLYDLIKAEKRKAQPIHYISRHEMLGIKSETEESTTKTFYEESYFGSEWGIMVFFISFSYLESTLMSFFFFFFE